MIQTLHRTIAITRARRAVLLALVVVLAACGASAREKTLQTQLVLLNTMRDTVLEVSKRREQQIVEDAQTREEGRAALDAWRKQVDVVIEAIGAGYRALASAALLEKSNPMEAVAVVRKAVEQARRITEAREQP